MISQPFSPPPSWLPLRLLLGGLIAGMSLWFTRQQEQSSALPARLNELGVRCGRSFIILVTALLVALTLGLAVGMLARKSGPLLEKITALFGRVLACLPVAALAWGFVGIWTGMLGQPVETLLPALLPEVETPWQTTLARVLWEFLVPALLLAVPLTGEVMHCVITDARATVDLNFSLHARGVPAGARLWRHHLGQLQPLLSVRVQALCLAAPVYLIVIEDVLHFMGWGGWMAHALRTGDVDGIAGGFFSGGMMMALLCLLARLPGGSWKSTRRFLWALSWQPWLLWALGLMVLPSLPVMNWIFLWAAVLVVSGAGWHRAWNEIEAALPVEAARVLGASESMIWRKHIAPVQFRMLAAWFCGVLAQTLLWIALACALRPMVIQDLGGPLAAWCRPLAVATMQDAAATLADPSAILRAGGSIALAALCLIQVGRIVQPRSH
jgi:hypothetical protein